MFIKRKEKFFSLDGTGVFVLLGSPCRYQCCRLTEFNDHFSLQTVSRVYLVRTLFPRCSGSLQNVAPLELRGSV